MASNNNITQLSVALPPRDPTTNGHVWSTTPAEPATPVSSCNVPDGACCRDTQGKKERVLLDPDVVRDLVIGLSDGLTVPFALTAGLSSTGNSRIVVLGGVAELISGAISMGVGGFLASSAERDHFRFLKKQTHARVERLCEGEMGRQVHEILGPVGIDENASQLVANELRKIESANYGADGKEIRHRHLARKTVDAEKGSQAETDIGAEDMGLTAFFLKFGEGLEDIPIRRLYISALTIGSGYLFGGIIPLLPYFWIEPAYLALYYSILITGVVLLVFGATKAFFTGAAVTWKGYVWGAVSMLAVGSFAAGSSFGIVYAINTRLGEGGC
ncbi:DUF125-domain-containing protein [Dacryopinax primogenitus]|uniref:DUF125-domain-containing protein n=1 Tax=Dacryopinax primogenitus (strain DJM 731) TaxID=1858805 RepID=M5GFK8_DACPD|nr:DUF125-domain-containing protein [Dacryopinax primogenitus]EJU04193.1 DUF125-domain-containing protein [Dacryopinax primogenitus]